jgi:hypothetical protein
MLKSIRNKKNAKQKTPSQLSSMEILRLTGVMRADHNPASEINCLTKGIWNLTKFPPPPLANNIPCVCVEGYLRFHDRFFFFRQMCVCVERSVFVSVWRLARVSCGWCSNAIRALECQTRQQRRPTLLHTFTYVDIRTHTQKGGFSFFFFSGGRVSFMACRT